MMPSSTPLCSIQPSVAPATHTWHLNVGSCGHPEMCRRRCLFFQEGGCRDGSSCNHCHFHHRRPAQLDKRTRKLLSEMEADTCLRTLLEAMRDRVPSLRFAAAAWQFLDTLESQCDRRMNADGAGIRKGRADKRHVHAVQILALHSMIQLFQKRSKDHLEPCAVTQIEEALEQLYAAIRAADLAAYEETMRVQGEYNSFYASSSIFRPTETLTADVVAWGLQEESDSVHQTGGAPGPEEWLAADGKALTNQAVSPVAFRSQHLAVSRNRNKIQPSWLEAAERWPSSQALL
eukprot:TRINITY_DN8034_c1_g1_i1.p1 TRINITY_DN8034_c1_g1~~TRINITY_DN8034_c1_g1_i1.p1  ORF type:complete len:290 (-),score=48.93 TRINITY_DN8034_c1_g1_i1:31-900(-)